MIAVQCFYRIRLTSLIDYWTVILLRTSFKTEVFTSAVLSSSLNPWSRLSRYGGKEYMKAFSGRFMSRNAAARYSESSEGCGFFLQWARSFKMAAAVILFDTAFALSVARRQSLTLIHLFQAILESSINLSRTSSRVKWFKIHDVSGTNSVPETSCILNHLTRLEARESFIQSCRREIFKFLCSLHWNLC